MRSPRTTATTARSARSTTSRSQRGECTNILRQADEQPEKTAAPGDGSSSRRPAPCCASPATPEPAASAESRPRSPSRDRSASEPMPASSARTSQRAHRVLLVDDVPLDLERGRELAGLLGEVVGRIVKLLDLLDRADSRVDVRRPPSGPRRASRRTRRSVRRPAARAARRTPATSSGSSVISATRYGRRSPITTACEIQRFCLSPFSRLAGVMFLPPAVMMMSFLRPVMKRKPSSSIGPRSPVCSQPSDERLVGGLLVLVVALEDVRPAQQHLAVLGDLHLDARAAACRPSRSGSASGRLQASRGGGLGHARSPP